MVMPSLSFKSIWGSEKRVSTDLFFHCFKEMVLDAIYKLGGQPRNQKSKTQSRRKRGRALSHCENLRQLTDGTRSFKMENFKGPS